MGFSCKDSRLFGRYTYYIPGVADSLILLLLMLVGAVIGNIVAAILMIAVKSSLATELSMLVSYPIMFIPPMIYASISSRNNSFGRSGVLVDSNHFGRHGLCRLAVAAALMTLSMAYVADLFSNMLPPMPEWLETMLSSMTGGNIVLDLICVSIFAPFFEEWLCRGMVLRGLLNNKVPAVWSIILSALFFALIHLNPWQAIPAFLLGCIFGYVYYKTGSIKLTMLMHFTNNTFAVICSRIPGFEDMTSWRDVFTGPGYWIVYAACIILAALCILAFHRVDLNSAEGNLDKVPSMFDQQ